jgi:predicted alpha/beta-hydrolase family hydrolase
MSRLLRGDPTDLLLDGPATADLTVVLAHGAGAPMDSPFMETIAVGLGEAGIATARFEFGYMARRRTENKRPGPPRAERLIPEYTAVIEALGGGDRVVIGGKSMGGRVASMAADEASVRGLVCLGYPFHPPGKPDALRTAHLEAMRTPALIVQGERDTFGRREEVEGYALSDSIRVEFLADGDHSFKPRKSSGITETEHLERAVELIAAFLADLA